MKNGLEMNRKKININGTEIEVIDYKITIGKRREFGYILVCDTIEIEIIDFDVLKTLLKFIYSKNTYVIEVENMKSEFYLLTNELQTINNWLKSAKNEPLKLKFISTNERLERKEKFSKKVQL